jgi:hypothetical protein
MIQRIQTLYLLLTTGISILFHKGSIINFTRAQDSRFRIAFNGIFTNAGTQEQILLEKLPYLEAIIILIPVLSLITIFLYKKRKIQLWFALSVVILSALLIIVLAYNSFIIIKNYDAQIGPVLKMIFPFLILAFAILAYMGIKKDDRIVRSYERMR